MWALFLLPWHCVIFSSKHKEALAIYISACYFFFLRGGEWKDYHSILFKCSQSLIKGRVLESYFV